MNAAAEAPTVLLPYQVESIELAEEHQFLVVEKSRRIGVRKHLHERGEDRQFVIFWLIV